MSEIQTEVLNSLAHWVIDVEKRLSNLAGS